MLEVLWDAARLGGIACVGTFLFLVFVFLVVKISVIAFYSGKREADRHQSESNKGGGE